MAFGAFGTGACSTTSAFLFLLVGVQSPKSNPFAVSAAASKLSIEQTSASDRPSISGAAARLVAGVSTAARTAADEVGVTILAGTTECSRGGARAGLSGNVV